MLGVARSPLVIAAAAGLVASALQLPVPVAGQTFFDILAAAAAPCALFAMGLFMVGRSVAAGVPELAWVVAMKLLVQPVAAWLIAFELLQLDPLWGTSAVVLSALPTGALVFVLAQQYGVYTQRASSAILISTVVSVVTLSAVFAYAGVG